jgi:tetratricopeptide (TPR) repeat protein
VLELVGDWERAETVELDGLELARTAGDEGSVAWAETALAEVARKQGRYDEAADRLSRAETVFERLGDAEGAGRVLHLAGTLAAQQGDHPRARARYQASLEIRERTGDRKEMASVLSNLGIVAEYEGENGLARSFHERALELRSEVGDRWAIAVSLTNLGMIDLSEKRHEEARARFDEAMRLSAEAGDSWMVAISHNNLGTALRESGGLAAARDHYAASLHTYRDYDDRWATAFLLEDVALLAAATDEPETALELVGGADRLREEIGSPLAPSLREQLDERLADARARLGGPASGAALERGRELSLAAAVAAALRFCSAGELENAARRTGR